VTLERLQFAHLCSDRVAMFGGHIARGHTRTTRVLHDRDESSHLFNREAELSTAANERQPVGIIPHRRVGRQLGELPGGVNRSARSSGSLAPRCRFAPPSLRFSMPASQIPGELFEAGRSPVERRGHGR